MLTLSVCGDGGIFCVINALNELKCNIREREYKEQDIDHANYFILPIMYKCFSLPNCTNSILDIMDEGVYSKYKETSF